MTDQPSAPDTAAGPADQQFTATPRWVKISAALAVIVVVLVVIAIATGGAGDHGPGRHSSGGDDQPAPSAAPAQPVAPEGQPPPSAIPSPGEPGHQPPPGAHLP